MENTQKYMNSNILLSASLDSTAQTGHAKGADWQEEIYQKVISKIYCSLDGVHVCHSLARFQWKKGLKKISGTYSIES